MVNYNFILLIYFFLYQIYLISSSTDLSEIINSIDMIKGIYKDFQIATSSGINIDSSLSDIEKDSRYYLLFNNFINNYSIKNSKLADMEISDFDIFTDACNSVLDGLTFYLGKNKNDLKKEAHKYHFMIDFIIENIYNALFIINKKKEYQKNLNAINKLKNNIYQLLLNYEKDQLKLKNLLNYLIDLENQVSGLTTIEKKIFEDYIAGKVFTEQEQYEFFNIILSAQSIIEYKNNIYIEKEKLLSKIFLKISELNAEIFLLLKKQNQILVKSQRLEKIKIDNISLEKAATENIKLRKVLQEMNVIISTGSKSPGKTNQVIPILGGIEGAKSGGVKGFFEGMGTARMNLVKKIKTLF